MRKGLDKCSQKLIAYLDGHLKGAASALDIGCGAGGVHHELLRLLLVNQAVGVDASFGYLAAAQANAKALGLALAVSYHRADFAPSAEQVMPALVGLSRDDGERHLLLSAPAKNMGSLSFCVVGG